MDMNYSDERSIQMLVRLMKEHGVRRVVASPGTTNIGFVASVQQDPWFEVYSSVDERSAAYVACGLAAESGEPVALSCTGATASRNYYPGLTEAFYRKLPVLAITSMLHEGRIGQNIPQIIDRRALPNDVVNLSVQVPLSNSNENEWSANLLINKALLALTHRGGGPAHINLMTTCSMTFGTRDLPSARVIRRLVPGDNLPELGRGRIGVFVGAHREWDDRLLRAVECFCQIHNAVVVKDHTSNYPGRNSVLANLIADQDEAGAKGLSFDVLVHIGDVSGAYLNLSAQSVWRVNPDGEIRDPFRTLRYVFEMEEALFFESYAAEGLCSQGEGGPTALALSLQNQWEDIASRMPDLPFSNLWVAKATAPLLPNDSVLYLGILNSLRAWNYFAVPVGTLCFSNTGGFGIDGGLSSLVGASLADKGRLHFGIVGDLGFFYDMNALGSRHIGGNVRIMLVNNGCGTEFRNYSHPASVFGEDASPYIAAEGHFGCKSPNLVRHYAEDLGFIYLSARSKEEYERVVGEFTNDALSEKPILLEVFTDNENESAALKMVRSIERTLPGAVKRAAKDALGPRGIDLVKKVARR